MPLILELERAYNEAKKRPGVPKAKWMAISRIMSAGRRRFISPSG